MSNDHDHDNDFPPIKPVFLTKIKVLSPRNLPNNREEIASKERYKMDYPRQKSLEEVERHFTTPNRESFAESSFAENKSEKNISGSNSINLRSQFLDKFISKRNSSLKSEYILNESPHFDEYHSKPEKFVLDSEAQTQLQGRFSFSGEEIIDNQRETSFYEKEDRIQQIINRSKLDQFSAEEIVDTIFCNEEIRTINPIVFEIKLEVQIKTKKCIILTFFYRIYIF